jgi:outer membrane protein OmpA-like peptidoglycan-associated protein
MSDVPPIVDEVLHSPGKSLDPADRSFMESRFGQDFSSVRIHMDAKAAESARAVQALAFTVGQHVVFGRGTYAPGSHEGRALLAHELVHTLQQIVPLASPLNISSPENSDEREAESVSKIVAQGQKAPKIMETQQGLIQRQVSEKEEIDWERANPAGQIERTFDNDMDIIILWNFAVGSPFLKSEHEGLLRKVAKTFAELSAETLLDIEGHTSNSGLSERNQTISKARAKEVKAFLQQEGVSGGQIIVSGMGSSAPWVSNTTAENMAKNRRVVLRVARIV